MKRILICTFYFSLTALVVSCSPLNHVHILNECGHAVMFYPISGYGEEGLRDGIVKKGDSYVLVDEPKYKDLKFWIKAKDETPRIRGQGKRADLTNAWFVLAKDGDRIYIFEVPSIVFNFNKPDEVRKIIPGLDLYVIYSEDDKLYLTDSNNDKFEKIEPQKFGFPLIPKDDKRYYLTKEFLTGLDKK